MEKTLKIILFICIVGIIILYEKNKERINRDIKKKQNEKTNKIFKRLILVVEILLILILCKGLYESVKSLINAINFYKISLENKKKEDNFYNYIISKYDSKECEPYIPNDFEYVSGSVECGYIIQDKKENQYVWIPCNNTTLTKRNFSKNARISYNYCYDENYEEFLNSALKNGGFYISRYEIGKEDNIPVSKENVEVWTDINLEEARKIINEMYKDEEINCEVINGYAYDTTLDWLMSNSDFSIEKNKIEEQILCGRNEINGIFDFTDNIFELTQERVYDVIVSRGFLDTDKSGSITSRYTLLEKDTNFVDGITKLSIRTIIYK